MTTPAYGSAGADNSYTNSGLAQMAWGYETGAVFRYSHMMGGLAGSHAEYVRVPFADYGAFTVPGGADDISAAVFTSDAAPTGWMGADLGGVQPGDVVAVWGAGGVGQMAARASVLLGAEKVMVIDRIPERLSMAEQYAGAETIDYSTTDVGAELRERTGGRVRTSASRRSAWKRTAPGPQFLYDQAKQQLRLQSERPLAVRDAILACRKGGSVFVLGVYGGLADKFPLGALMNKGLTVRGAQMHGQRYIPMLLDRIAAGDLDIRHLVTHEMTLDEAPRGYQMFKDKEDGCVRAVFRPHA